MHMSHVRFTHMYARQGRALDLVELGQVRAVDGLVAEHAVDGEEARRAEAACRQRVQHARGHRRRVRAQQVLLRLRLAPGAAVPVLGFRVCYL